jgi:hypothetical protein
VSPTSPLDVVGFSWLEAVQALDGVAGDGRAEANLFF